MNFFIIFVSLYTLCSAQFSPLFLFETESEIVDFLHTFDVFLQCTALLLLTGFSVEYLC